MREQGRVGQFCGFAAVALVAMALLAPAASAAGGSISGTVTETGTGTPVEGAWVCAFPKNHEIDPNEFCVLSGLNGEYSLNALPEDEYLLEFQAAYLNYLGQYYPEADELSKAKILTLGEGESLTGKDAHLTRAAEIAGTVTDASTEGGIEDVEVCAFAVAGFDEGCGFSGSEGSYAIPGLRAGEYAVAFFPVGASGYLAQYYDHVTAKGEAKAVAVALGEVVPGIDGALALGAVVTGRVTAANGGAGLGGIEVCALHTPTKVRETCAKTAGDGTYALRSLPSGEYAISFSEEIGPSFVDEFETQYFAGVPGFAEAAALALAAPETRGGVDARLLRPGETLEKPAEPQGAPPAPAPTETSKHPLRCKKGFVKKKVRGRARCVRKKKHRHRHRRRHAGRG